MDGIEPHFLGRVNIGIVVITHVDMLVSRHATGGKFKYPMVGFLYADFVRHDEMVEAIE